ncbi:MAG TPA: glycine betaine ABC transporter substrate-binding protein, partial [Candidatus Deferrimicrobium sp.]|nr:glycine betaine ABC transporter substrate-binding protein [Candidatus Deferrimicrobium sp.]
MNRKAIAAMVLVVSGTVASCGSSSNNTTSSSGGGGGPSASAVKICILSEFRTRPDGLPGLESKYNSAFSKATYTDIGNTAETTIANGQCNAGEVFTTDSAIGAKNLYVLQDDKN